MTTMLLTRYNVNLTPKQDQLKPSQLKPYRDTIKMVYDNPEFKDIYNKESNKTVLKMLSYLEIMREKSEQLIRGNCEKLKKAFGKNSFDIDENAIKETTKLFINDNIQSVKKLADLPSELQPSKKDMELLTSLSFKNK